MPFISPDPRSRPPGGVTHRENAPRNTAAHRGKRQPRSPRPAGGELPREPAPRQQPRRGLSHEDTSFGPAPWACGPCPARKPHRTIGPSPGLVRLGHIHKSISPFNQHRRRGLAPGGIAALLRTSQSKIEVGSHRSRPGRRNRPPAAAPVGASRCSSVHLSAGKAVLCLWWR